jgi:hypothetical protein
MYEEDPGDEVGVKITMKNKGKFVNLQLKSKIKRSQNKDILYYYESEDFFTCYHLYAHIECKC